jgi:hypothetical protein
MIQREGEWIEVNLPFDGYSGDKLPHLGDILKPGMVVEMADGSQYLLGDINMNRGLCDCCAAFARGDIVKRYKVVYEKED